MAASDSLSSILNTNLSDNIIQHIDSNQDLPNDPNTCLFINQLYQDSLRQILENVELALAVNRERQRFLIERYCVIDCAYKHHTGLATTRQQHSLEGDIFATRNHSVRATEAYSALLTSGSLATPLKFDADTCSFTTSPAPDAQLSRGFIRFPVLAPPYFKCYTHAQPRNFFHDTDVLCTPPPNSDAIRRSRLCDTDVNSICTAFPKWGYEAQDRLLLGVLRDTCFREQQPMITRLEIEQSRLDQVEKELELLRDENEPQESTSIARRSRAAKTRSGLANNARQREALEKERATLLERMTTLNAQLEEMRARSELPSIEQLCFRGPNEGADDDDDDGPRKRGRGGRGIRPLRGRPSRGVYTRAAATRPLYLVSDANREPVSNPLVMRLRSDPALLECDAERVDWLRISAELFEGRFSDLECRLFWTNELRPRINREPWIVDEQRSLARLVEKHEARFWSLIADELATGRTAFQCLQRYQQHLNPDFQGNRAWTPHEDSMLVDVVSLCKRISPDSRYRFYWRRVASFLDCRTAIECEVRFVRLCPEQSRWNQKLKVYRWTPEEDMRFLQALVNAATERQREGPGGAATAKPDWEQVARAVGSDRTPAECRIHHERLLRNEQESTQLKPFTYAEDRILVQHLLERQKADDDTKYSRAQWGEILKKFPTRTLKPLINRFGILKRWRRSGAPMARGDVIDDSEGGAHEPPPLPSSRSKVASGELWVRYLLDPVRFDGQLVTDPVTGQAIREMLQNGETEAEVRAKLKCTPSLYASRSRTVQLVPPEEFSQLVEDARTGWLTPQVASWFLNRRYDPFQHDVGLRKIGNTIRDRRSAFMKIVPSIRAHMFKQLDTTQMLNYNYRVLLSVKEPMRSLIIRVVEGQLRTLFVGGLPLLSGSGQGCQASASASQSKLGQRLHSYKQIPVVEMLVLSRMLCCEVIRELKAVAVRRRFASGGQKNFAISSDAVEGLVKEKLRQLLDQLASRGGPFARRSNALKAAQSKHYSLNNSVTQAAKKAAAASAKPSERDSVQIGVLTWRALPHLNSEDRECLDAYMDLVWMAEEEHRKAMPPSLLNTQHGRKGRPRKNTLAIATGKDKACSALEIELVQETLARTSNEVRAFLVDLLEAPTTAQTEVLEDGDRESSDVCESTATSTRLGTQSSDSSPSTSSVTRASMINSFGRAKLLPPCGPTVQAYDRLLSLDPAFETAAAQHVLLLKRERRLAEASKAASQAASQSESQTQRKSQKRSTGASSSFDLSGEFIDDNNEEDTSNSLVAKADPTLLLWVGLCELYHSPARALMVVRANLRLGSSGPLPLLQAMSSRAKPRLSLNRGQRQRAIAAAVRFIHREGLDALRSVQLPPELVCFTEQNEVSTNTTTQTASTVSATTAAQPPSQPSSSSSGVFGSASQSQPSASSGLDAVAISSQSIQTTAPASDNSSSDTAAVSPAVARLFPRFASLFAWPHLLAHYVSLTRRGADPALAHGAVVDEDESGKEEEQEEKMRQFDELMETPVPTEFASGSRPESAEPPVPVSSSSESPPPVRIVLGHSSGDSPTITTTISASTIQSPTIPESVNQAQSSNASAVIAKQKKKCGRPRKHQLLDSTADRRAIDTHKGTSGPHSLRGRRFGPRRLKGASSISSVTHERGANVDFEDALNVALTLPSSGHRVHLLVDFADVRSSLLANFSRIISYSSSQSRPSTPPPLERPDRPSSSTFGSIGSPVRGTAASSPDLGISPRLRLLSAAAASLSYSPPFSSVSTGVPGEFAAPMPPPPEYDADDDIDDGFPSILGPRSSERRYLKPSNALLHHYSPYV